MSKATRRSTNKFLNENARLRKEKAELEKLERMDSAARKLTLPPGFKR